MGLNVIGNAVFIAIMFFVMIGLVLSFEVLSQINDGAEEVVYDLGVVPLPFMMHFDDYKSYFLSAVQFLFYLQIGLIVYSSFVNVTSIRSYVMGAVGGVIASVLISYIITSVWNGYMNTVPELFDGYTANDLWFISSVQYVILVNLLAGLLSFMFAAQNQQKSVIA